MKKHLLVCLLALVLASLCMLPSQVQAAEETHDHCTCGADHVSIDGHTTDSSRPWTPWTPVSNDQVQWPTAGNVYYYLTDDVEINETWKVVSDNATSIYICLNGHSITMNGYGPAIELDGTSAGIKASLVITDCMGTGKITHKGTAEGPAVKVCGFGSFTMYGGTITGNHVNGDGGGVCNDGTNSSFIMYGGTITNNSATNNGGGVYVGNGKQAYVWVGGNARIVDNKAGSKIDSGIYFSDSSSFYKTKLSVKKLITDARIAIDNDNPKIYITNGSKGNYDIDTNGVLTAPSHKSHYLCGSSDNTGCTSADCKAKGEVTFTEWKRDDILPTSGNYYLTKNVTLRAGQPITGDVTLCLNGYKIEAASGVEPIILNNGYTLTITDCVGSGSIVGVDKKLTGVNIKSDAGTLNLYGGTIRNFAKGVENSGTFNMYGGKLTQNSQGVSNTGTFNMHGGSITKNSGFFNGAGVSNEGNFTMSGGDITSNTASQSGTENNGFGGGVHNRSSFVMTDGTITGNTAKNDGGGVYSGSNSTYIYGGSITSNNAKRGDDVYAASNCGVHLKGNVTIGGDRSNGLLTNTVHYIDGTLDTGSAIRLFVLDGTTDGTELLQPGGSHKITPEDLKKFSLKNGYEVTLNDKDNGVLSLPHRHQLGTSITFKEWTDAEAKKMYPGTDATAASCLPNEGDWYLKQNVTLTAPHVVDGGELNLCLNGNKVTLNADGAVFSVKSGGVLNLTDCKSTGIITHADSKNGTGVSVEAGGDGTAAGTFNLYNGNITGNSTSGDGGGVSVFSYGQFNMYGGSITNNKAAAGGGVYVSDNATVTISGGTITKNEATSDGGGMTVGNCQVTLSGKVTITGNKSTDGKNSNLYIKGGQGVTIDSSSFASTSKVVFKDRDDKYAGTDYITNANDLKSNQLTCLTTDAGRQFVMAGEENKVYVATVLKDKPTAQNLVYNGEEQTGVIATADAGECYTITGTTKATQANTAYAEGDENRNGYKAVVTLNPGYALYHKNTYYVADTPLNLDWRIEPKKAAAEDFVVDKTTLTTTYDDHSYKGVTVTVAKKYTKHSENWDGKLEVYYLVDGEWTNEVPTDAGTYQLQVHIENDGNFAAGYVPLTDVLTIKPASQTKPDSNIFEVTAPTSVNGTDGKITGVNDNMEYSTDGQNWKPCDGDTIIGSSRDYQIRYKAEQPNYKCSEAVTVNIPVHTHTLSGEVPAEAHRKSPATCTRKAVYCQYCTACGAEDTGKTFEFGNMLPHDYNTDVWTSVDNFYHAHPCKICGAYDETSKAPHEFSGKEPNCKAIGCDYRRTMYDVTLTTNYPVDCSVTTQNGILVTSIIGGVAEGTAVTVSGNTLRIGDETLTFSTNNGEQYSYTFTGWTIDGRSIPENYTIIAPVTIKANFNRVVNQYTVTWDAAGGIIQDTGYTSGTQDWGTPINAPSNVVKKPDSSCSYTFTH